MSNIKKYQSDMDYIQAHMSIYPPHLKATAIETMYRLKRSILLEQGKLKRESCQVTFKDKNTHRWHTLAMELPLFNQIKEARQLLIKQGFKPTRTSVKTTEL